MLTKEQLKNLKVFLSRVDLKGAEVPVFVDILRALDEEPKKEDKKVTK